MHKKGYNPPLRGGHKRSQRVTKGHKIAPGPSASECGQSQRVTKLHQALAPTLSGSRKRLQKRTRPQRQRILAVTRGQEIAPGLSVQFLEQITLRLRKHFGRTVWLPLLILTMRPGPRNDFQTFFPYCNLAPKHPDPRHKIRSRHMRSQTSLPRTSQHGIW